MMQGRSIERRRPGRFWVLLAGVGLLTPAIVGVLFTTVLVSIGSVGEIQRNGFTLGDVSVFGSAIFDLSLYGVYLASILAPLTAIAVPASYATSVLATDDKPNLAAFLLAMTVFGVVGPLGLGAVLDKLPAFSAPDARAISSGSSAIAGVYAFFGIAVAPLTAFVLWPLLTRLDNWFGIGASGTRL